MVLPPNLAPIQVVIVPIYKGTEQLEEISIVANKIKADLETAGVSVKFDHRDNIKPGFKFNDYELKGVPLRIAIGPKDLEKQQVELSRRDILEKSFVSQTALIEMIPALLEEIQASLYNKAFSFRDEHITAVNSYEEFKTVLEEKGGFISAHWDGTEASEEAIKKETKATIRCIPYDTKQEEGSCVYSGAPSAQRVLFAKAY